VLWESITFTKETWGIRPRIVNLFATENLNLAGERCALDLTTDREALLSDL